MILVITAFNKVQRIVTRNFNSQKGIVPITAIFILAIILVGGGAYYFKQQAKQISKTNVVDATANWKTYNNPTFGVEFKYPAELKLQENNDNVKILQGMGYFFEVGKIDNIDIETWISSQRQIKIVEGIPPYIISKVEFKQRPAYYLKQATLAQVPMDRFAVQINGYILTIAYKVASNLDFYSNLSDKQRVKKTNEEFISTEKIIIDQILSTLKLTNQNQTINTSTWKTYTNTQYGFEIKYPADTRTLKEGDQGLIASINLPSSDFRLSSTGINVSVIDDKSCTAGIGTKIFNGITFLITRENTEDAATGGERRLSSVYHAAHNNKCLQIKSSVGYTSVKFSATKPTIQEIQQEKDWIHAQQQLNNQILSTFKFTDQASTPTQKQEVFDDGSTPTTWAVAGINDPQDFKNFFVNFQQLVKKNQKSEIAKLIRYPLKDIKNEADFVKNYDQMLTQKVKTEVINQNVEQMFRNYQGVMVGNGEIWFHSIVGKSGYWIIAINN